MMGPPHCTYGLGVPASCVPYAPEAQGGSTVPAFERAVHTAYRGTTGTDLLYFAFNMPMDLLLLCSSGFSVSLWLSLNAYQVHPLSPYP